MAVVCFEGWDNYGTAANALARVGVLQWSGGSGLALASPGRNGSGLYASQSNYGWLTGAFAANYAAGYVGFGMRGPGALQVVDGATATPQVTLVFNSLYGTISILQGDFGATVFTSANNAYNAAVWQFVEIFASVGATGTVTVQVGGAQVATWTGATQHSANASFSAVRMQGAATGNINIDDFRFCDTTAGPGLYPANSWMGDLFVGSVSVAANDTVSWTPLSGTNWQMVSETAFDGDTTYNAVTASGYSDLFTTATPAQAIGAIVAVQVMGALRETVSSTQYAELLLGAGGTTHTGAAHSLAVSYQFFTDLYPVNPTAGRSWQVADFPLAIGYAY